MLPVNGSREALFALAQTVIDQAVATLVVCPNPFYQIYEGRGAARRAPSPYSSIPRTRRATSPSITTRVPADVWARTQLLYVCSPGNPTGAVMPLDEWRKLFELSDRHGFVIASDECYSEIYFGTKRAAAGRLEAAAHGWAARTSAPGGVHQPVQALQRARHALGLRRRRRARC